MKVLFVCTGNTCRSPMAAAYLASKKLKNIQVESAGINALGDPVSAKSIVAMNEIGIEILNPISRSLRPEDLSSDLIICMSEEQRQALVMVAPNSEKVMVMPGSIPDPYGGTQDIYNATRDRITSVIDKLIYDGTICGVSVTLADISMVDDIYNIELNSFSQPWSKESISGSMNAGTMFFVVKKGDKICGYCGLSKILDEGYVTNIAVLTEYRGLGMGDALVSYLVDYAKNSGMSFVSLEVRKSNVVAINLYTKYNFVIEGQRKNFYSAPIEDALIMTKRF